MSDLAILSVEEMPEWWRKVQKLKNPIVREALLFTLLSGLRRSSLESLKWTDLDLKRGCMRVAVAKGDKAFDLILSRPIIRCLWRARRDGRMLFPSTLKLGIPGRVRPHYRQLALTKYPGSPQTMRSGAPTRPPQQLAGVDEPTVGRLLNHGGRSVTARYIGIAHRQDARAAQDDISAYFMKALH